MLNNALFLGSSAEIAGTGDFLVGRWCGPQSFFMTLKIVTSYLAIANERSVEFIRKELGDRQGLPCGTSLYK